MDGNALKAVGPVEGELYTSTSALDHRDAFDSALLLSSLIDQFGRMALGGITVRQAILIWKIGSTEDPPRLFDLAVMMYCSHQNIRSLLTKLEELEYVVLFDDPYDRRARRVALRASGREVYRSLAEERERFYEAFERHVPERGIGDFCSTVACIAETFDEVAPQGLGARWCRQMKKDHRMGSGGGDEVQREGDAELCSEGVSTDTPTGAGVSVGALPLTTAVIA